MDTTIDKLARDLLNVKIDTTRYIVGVYGIPGSGKSELARAVAERYNSLAKGDNRALVVGMDGFHYSRAQLDGFGDPIEAHRRRGAHFTFDAAGFVELVSKMHAQESLSAPSFSHALKDPVENDIQITPKDKIILLEGLYVSLSTPEWKTASESLNERWLITVAKDIARLRVANRHVRAGLADTEEKGLDRADFNDMPNGDFVLANSLPPTRIIASIDDDHFAGN